MIRIEPYKNLYARIRTDDISYLKEIMKFFKVEVPNHQFMPKYRSGFWDGKFSFFSPGSRSFPVGLLFEYLRFHTKAYPTLPIELDEKLKSNFTSYDVPQEWDNLPFDPYWYQKESLDYVMKYKRGILKLTTASGKSYLVAGIANTLMKHDKLKKLLIIVPRIDLVHQFYENLLEYNFDEKLLGKVWSKDKQFDKKIVISTWQSLKNNHDILPEFDGFICDEVHETRKSEQIKNILQKCVNADLRIGVTGTLPSEKLYLWNILSYIGPIIKTITPNELMDTGHISRVSIKTLYMDYPKNYNKYNYFDTRTDVFKDERRLNLLKEISDYVKKEPILYLVTNIEKEGSILQNYLIENTDKEVIFLSGKDNNRVRSETIEKIKNTKNIIVIATYPLFSTGINIPSLKYLCMASPMKSDITVLQTIGRTLRKHKTKEKTGAIVFDIVDDVTYLRNHALKRLRYYYREGYDVDEDFTFCTTN